MAQPSIPQAPSFGDTIIPCQDTLQESPRASIDDRYVHCSGWAPPEVHIPQESDRPAGLPDSETSYSKAISTRYQLLLDASASHRVARWTFTLLILLVFMLRIVLAQGWYVICYGLSIYYLNLFIGFLSPKMDPPLPLKADDEFRPFIRRVPEFKFWLSATKATLISLFLTLFEIFDLPVFWPILLLYFILLFISTMRDQIRHMLEHGYVPWDKGKKRYGRADQEPLGLVTTI